MGLLVASQVSDLTHQLESERKGGALAHQRAQAAVESLEAAMRQTVMQTWRSSTDELDHDRDVHRRTIGGGAARGAGGAGAGVGSRGNSSGAGSQTTSDVDREDVARQTRAEDWSILANFLHEAGVQSNVFAPGASAAASLQEISSAVGILETCSASAMRLEVDENDLLRARLDVLQRELRVAKDEANEANTHAAQSLQRCLAAQELDVHRLDWTAMLREQSTAEVKVATAQAEAAVFEELLRVAERDRAEAR